MQSFFEIVTHALEVTGVAAMVIGFAVAAVLGIRSWATSRDGRIAFTTLRDSIGSRSCSVSRSWSRPISCAP